MRFKFCIFVFFLVLICESRFEGQTVRVLQDGEVREKKGSSAADGNHMPKEEVVAETNPGLLGAENQASDTTQPPLTQQLIGQQAPKDDQYQHLPVDLDSANGPAQDPNVLGQTSPPSQPLNTQQPHIPYKGPQTFAYPDDSQAATPQSKNQTSNTSISTSQQQPQPQDIFGQKDNKTEQKIEEFRPEEVEKMGEQNTTEESKGEAGEKGNKTQVKEKQQQVGNKNETNKVENQTNSSEKNQTHEQNSTKQQKHPQPQSNTTTSPPTPESTNSSSTTPAASPSAAYTLLQEKVAHLTQQLKSLESSNNLLTGQKNQLQNELLLSKKQVTSLKQNLQQTKTQIKELQAQFKGKLSSAQLTKGELQEENKKLKGENQKLKREKQQLKKAKVVNQGKTQENKVANQGNKQDINQTHSPQSSSQSSQLLIKLQEQKVMIQNEQKQLNQLNQAINSLKAQTQASHQAPPTSTTPTSPSSNPQPSQQLTSLDKRLTQLHTAVSQLSTQQKSHQSSSSSQQSLLSQVLQQVKSLRSNTPSTPTTPSDQTSSPPSTTDPQSVRQSSTPTGIQKQQTGYRVDILVDWMSIYIVSAITGVLILLFTAIKVCKRCRNIKRGKAEDQKQLKTPKSMESRSTQEQFSDWQG